MCHMHTRRRIHVSYRKRIHVSYEEEDTSSRHLPKP
jgi:hypothetical protein